MGVVRQVVFHQPPQGQLGGVGQVGHPRGIGPEPVQRLPLRRGARHGHQPVGGHRQVRELARIEPDGQRRVVVHEREVRLVALQHAHGVGQRPGADAQLAALQNGLQAHQPVGHHGARQGAARGQGHGAGLAPGQALQLFVRLREVAHHLPGGVQKTLPGRREGDGASAPLHQRRARPGLQRADAAAKRGVGDMPQLGGTGEAALLRQHDEVFQPFQLHRRLLEGRLSGGWRFLARGSHQHRQGAAHDRRG